MRGLAYSSWGEPRDVLRVMEDLPDAAVEHEEDVLVRVHAASINPADVKHMEGGLAAITSRPFPIKPGFDFSGVVVAKGARVGDRIQVGDEVCGMTRALRTGTTCELIAVNEYVVSKKPAGVPHVKAAAVPLAAITAAQCLQRGGLEPRAPAAAGGADGPRVFVTGGPGGVGTFVIQLAKKMFGASRVVTTASTPDKAELCRRLGADQVVDYRTSKFEQVLKDERFDVCVDCTGEASRMVRLTRSGGAVVSITAHPTKQCLVRWLDAMGPVPGVRVLAVARFAIVHLPEWLLDGATGAAALRRNGVDFDHVITLPSRDALDPILALVASGDVDVVVDGVFPLDRGVDAYVRSASGKAVGKVVVELVPSAKPAA